MSLLSNWISRLKPPKNESKADGPVEPPKLPSPRPRPLTPTPDNEINLHPQTQSLFFSKLPPEIRLRIYEYAFGNRTVHAQLVYDHRIIKGGRGHAGLGTGEGQLIKQDLKHGKRWRWLSCACCRRDARTFYHDGCLKSMAVSCGKDDNDKKDKRECHIDAIPWLLVCRKAYAESITTLYASNTFHFRMHTTLPPNSNDDDDDRHRPDINSIRLFAQLVLPQRLAATTSLEVVCETADPPRPGAAPDARAAAAAYKRTWQQVLVPLAGLRKLRISFYTLPMRYIPGLGPSPELDAAWLGVADEAVRTRRGALELELVVPASWFDAFDKKGAAEVEVGCLFDRKYWRSLEGGGGGEEDEEGAGGTAAATTTSTTTTRGYWICEQEEYVDIMCSIGGGGMP